MNSPNDISDEAKLQRSLTVIPASSVRIVKVNSVEAFKRMGVEYVNLRRGLLKGENIHIDTRRLL